MRKLGQLQTFGIAGWTSRKQSIVAGLVAIT
ncbi:MAG: hypothetical protein RL030_391 [Pseudomonadota bacterium]